jgi:hypothetical protein
MRKFCIYLRIRLSYEWIRANMKANESTTNPSAFPRSLTPCRIPYTVTMDQLRQPVVVSREDSKDRAKRSAVGVHTTSMVDLTLTPDCAPSELVFKVPAFLGWLQGWKPHIP